MNKVAKIEESVLVDEDGKQLLAADIKPRKEIAPIQQVGGVNDLIAMAINKDLDMDKLDRLLAMKEREEEKTAYSAFIVAMNGFQGDCPTIKKIADGDRYTYAPMDEILRTIRPHLLQWGLSVRFDSAMTENAITATCKVSHIGGHVDESSFTCPIEIPISKAGNKMMNGSQAAASANTYAKRNALNNALYLVASDFDDDGAGIEVVTITPEQAATLRDHLSVFNDAKGAEQDLCKWLNVSTLEDLPVRFHSRAQKAINEQKKAECKS